MANPEGYAEPDVYLNRATTFSSRVAKQEIVVVERGSKFSTKTVDGDD
jgi:hypothetical protein